MWDPDGTRLVLVPYGAPMWEPVKVDGGQEVQTSAPVRARGTRNHPRGNESHRIDFTIGRIKGTVAAALEANFEDALALPRLMRDVLLSFQDGRQYRVRHCAIQSWPHGHEEHLCRQTVRIAGGEIVRDTGSYGEGVTWGESWAAGLVTEGGVQLVTEDGHAIVEESN